MNIEPFNLDVINKYNMFFMLQKLNATSTINLYYQEVNNDVPFEDCSLFEMSNGKVLVAFPEYFTHISKHNLVATDGVVSEIVSLQIFERIYKYYKHGVDSIDAGGFTFMNSAPVPSFDNQWRCDAGLYGVELFADPLGDSTIVVPDAADALLVYEPVLSINGVAHLVYIERENKNNKTELMNNSSTPFATYSLGEALKLILEWAQVSQAPFSNTESVAMKAFEFAQQLGIEETLVSNQPDMQIFEYLKGNLTARMRPENVQPLSPTTEVFIKKNVAHSCLSSIVSLYPDAAPITEVKQAEQQKLLRDVESLNLSASLLNDPSNKNMAFYLKSRTELFTIKQEILQSL
jgi:hypothetical protein